MFHGNEDILRRTVGFVDMLDLPHLRGVCVHWRRIVDDDSRYLFAQLPFRLKFAFRAAGVDSSALPDGAHRAPVANEGVTLDALLPQFPQVAASVHLHNVIQPRPPGVHLHFCCTQGDGGHLTFSTSQGPGTQMHCEIGDENLLTVATCDGELRRSGLSVCGRHFVYLYHRANGELSFVAAERREQARAVAATVSAQRAASRASMSFAGTGLWSAS